MTGGIALAEQLANAKAARARIVEAGIAFSGRRTLTKTIAAVTGHEKAARRKTPPAALLVLSERCLAIVNDVAKRNRVDIRAMLTAKWTTCLVTRWARYEAMYRCVTETPLTLAEVGRATVWRGRSGETIAYGVLRHHMRTGAPLPEGYEWSTGRAKRLWKR